LTDTYYAATQATPVQAPGYTLLADGYHEVTALDLPEVAAAAGCILADADDVLRYAEALFGGKLLTDEQWLKMAEWREMGDALYGLGLMRKQSYGIEFIGHSGGTLGYRAGMYWLPAEDLIIVGLSNLGESDFGSVLVAAVRHVLKADAQR
jgi:D-alanyl-D-alanine carboxypeptidase